MTTSGWTYSTSGHATVTFVVPQPCACGCQDTANAVVPRQLLREAMAVSHPDLHSEGRKAKATKVMQGITAILARRVKP